MPRPPGEIPPHGTRRRYQHREQPCRCADCRRDNAAKVAAWRARRVGPVQLELPDELRLETYAHPA
jgi:hypothetical protein